MPSLPLPDLVAPYEGQTRPLTPDESEVLAKSLQNEIFGLKALLDYFVKDNTADLHMVYTVFSSAEYNRARMCKLLGIEMDAVEAREARVASLRDANGRIRELEAQLGQAASPEACAMLLKDIGSKLNHWWDTHGFGYVREMRFSEYGHLEAQFSCSLHGALSMFSDTPVSDRESKQSWLMSLQQRGFVLAPKSRGSDACVVDCDQSRDAIRALFAAHFPTARITKTENHMSKTQAELWGVTVHFNDLAELHKLPSAPAD